MQPCTIRYCIIGKCRTGRMIIRPYIANTSLTESACNVEEMPIGFIQYCDTAPATGVVFDWVRP